MSSDTPQRPTITFRPQATTTAPPQVDAQYGEQQYQQQAYAARPEPEVRPVPFFQRHAIPLAIGAVFFLTFALGIMTALVFTGGDRYAQAPVAAPVTPVNSLQAVVSESLETEVSRSSAADLLAVTPTNEVRLDPQASELASAVLLGLTPKRTVGNLTPEEAKQKASEAQAILHNNKLRMLREGVMAGVYKIETVERDGKRRVRLSTVNAKVTQDHLANLLRQAAKAGKIVIPASLSTAGGDVDMDTMLFNLVQTSLANDGTVAGAEAAREMSRRAFAASRAKTRDVGGERVYVVQAGDSLAYISLQFYGRPSDFDRIFQANKDVLTSPDRIQIGQRLKIPS